MNDVVSDGVEKEALTQTGDEKTCAAERRSETEAWRCADTYSWRKVGDDMAEIMGFAVHGRSETSVVENDIDSFGAYADGYNDEGDTVVSGRYNCFGEPVTRWVERISLVPVYRTREDKRYGLGSNIMRIDDYAFYNCVNLRGIIIPESVTEIAETAFEGCKNLTIWTWCDAENVLQYAEKHYIPVAIMEEPDRPLSSSLLC